MVRLINSSSPCPVLIPSYNKPARLAGLVTSLLRFGFTELWFSLDGPKDSDSEKQHCRIKGLISDLRSDSQISVSVLESPINLGGPKAVPRGLKWFFSSIHASIGLVLEEDLQLIRDPKPLIGKFAGIDNDRVIGGTLFAAGDYPVCQIAPLFEPWGWFMSVKGWQRLQSIRISRQKLAQSLALTVDKNVCSFWLAIYDRIYQDGATHFPLHWDYDVYLKMLQEKLLFLHPPGKLCVNHGYGKRAQNTISIPNYALTVRPLPSNSLLPAPIYGTTMLVSRMSYGRHHVPSSLFSRMTRHICSALSVNGLRALAFWFRNKLDGLAYELRARQVLVYRYRGLEMLGNHDLRVNIGAGNKHLAGYMSIDARDINGQAVVQMSPYISVRPGSVREIYSSHVLEHFSWRQTRSIFSNYYRALAKGGQLRIAVPDFSWFVAEYNRGIDLKDLLPVLYGEQDYEFNAHMTIFDRHTMSRLLFDAGFSDVREWDAQEFFASMGCEADNALHPCSLNLLAIK